MEIIEAAVERRKPSYVKGRWHGGAGEIHGSQNAISVEVEGTDAVGEVKEEFGNDVVDTLEKIAEKVRKDIDLAIHWDDVDVDNSGEIEKGSLFVQFWVWKKGEKQWFSPASIPYRNMDKVLAVMEKVVKADGWKWSKEEF